MVTTTILIIIICLLMIILCSYYSHRGEKTFKMVSEILSYISFLSSKEINNNHLTHWAIYYELYEKQVNFYRLALDLRINLNKFKVNFINQINKIHYSNKETT